jgi:hypothetical protein
MNARVVAVHGVVVATFAVALVVGELPLVGRRLAFLVNIDCAATFLNFFSE